MIDSFLTYFVTLWRVVFYCSYFIILNPIKPLLFLLFCMIALNKGPTFDIPFETQVIIYYYTFWLNSDQHNTILPDSKTGKIFDLWFHRIDILTNLHLKNKNNKFVRPPFYFLLQNSTHYDLQVILWLGFSRKKSYPSPSLLRISIFLKLTTQISWQIYRDPLGNPHFFSIFGLPPGIPTTFTLPPRIFHWYPQQRGYNFFFWKSPFELYRFLEFHD